MPPIKKYKNNKLGARVHRKDRIRKKIAGTAERPRLTIFRSAKHIYAQAVDDVTNTVVASACDLEETLQGSITGKSKKDKAKAVGQAVAKKLIARGVKLVVFDRNGFIYHGRVSAVADGAREAGLQF